MKLDVLFTAHEAEAFDFTQRIAVVIDVLRATTTISAALENRVSRVVPVSTIEAARNVSESNPRMLLCGERKGYMIEGFDYGNSPVTISQAPIEGRDIVLTTTNGTGAVVASRESVLLVAGSLRNVGAASAVVARRIETTPGEIAGVVVVCAGTNGRFSIDDVYAAGCFVGKLEVVVGEETEMELSDSAQASKMLASQPSSTVVNRRTCRHVGLLEDIGFAADVEYAFEIDASSMVPVYTADGFVDGAGSTL